MEPTPTLDWDFETFLLEIRDIRAAFYWIGASGVAHLYLDEARKSLRDLIKNKLNIKWRQAETILYGENYRGHIGEIDPELRDFIKRLYDEKKN